MATIRDVAEKAGVSTATVSHILNRTRYVSDELKTRVFHVMEELDYHPDGIARSLRKKATNTIGLVISDIQNPFYPAIVRGVEDVVIKDGYNLILCNTDESLTKEKAYVKILYEKRIDGLIITPTFGGHHDHLRSLIDKGIPLICVDRELDDLAADCALVDNFRGAYEAVSHILDRGHERVAIISVPRAMSTGKARFEGYAKALQDRGLPILSELVMETAPREEGGYAAARELLGNVPRPSALFAVNNLLALGALRAIKESKLRIPKDIALVCFDDASWAKFTDPPITTIAQPTYEIGKTAAELLIKRLKGKKLRGQQKIVLQPRLVVRESV